MTITIQNQEYSNGFDISYYQQKISFLQAGPSHDFCYARIQYGLKTDSMWMRNWNASRSHINRGVYSFLVPEQGARVQAEWLCELLSMAMPAELPVALDVERFKPKKEDVIDWLQYVELHTGVRPIIYGSALSLDGFLGVDPVWSRYKLWVADYGKPAGQPRLPSVFPDWAIHQYTNTGKVPGIVGNVDLSVCRGDILDALRS